MSLRGQPLEQEASLPDGRVLRVRIGVPEDSYIRQRELETVAVELWDEQEGEHVAAVATMLAPDQDGEARALLREIVAGLESGALAPTAGALEPLASTLR